MNSLVPLMKFIGHNSDVINYLTNDLTLLNAVVKDFRIYPAEDGLAISIMFELAYTGADVMLTFTNVFTNGFESPPLNGQYQVDSCKFYHIGSKVYLSLDPDESEEGFDGISAHDNDFILSAGVEGYIFDGDVG